MSCLENVKNSDMTYLTIFTYNLVSIKRQKSQFSIETNIQQKCTIHRHIKLCTNTESYSTKVQMWTRRINDSLMRVRVMVLSATFNNISVISWRSVLMVEQTRVPGEIHSPAASHWQTFSHNVSSRTSRQDRDSNPQR